MIKQSCRLGIVLYAHKPYNNIGEGLNIDILIYLCLQIIINLRYGLFILWITHFLHKNIIHERKQYMINTYQTPLNGNKIGIVFGTFAPLHQGHLDLIMKAKKECDGGCIVIVDGRDNDRVIVVLYSRPKALNPCAK